MHTKFVVFAFFVCGTYTYEKCKIYKLRLHILNNGGQKIFIFSFVRLVGSNLLTAFRSFFNRKVFSFNIIMGPLVSWFLWKQSWTVIFKQTFNGVCDEEYKLLAFSKQYAWMVWRKNYLLFHIERRSDWLLTDWLTDCFLFRMLAQSYTPNILTSIPRPYTVISLLSFHHCSSQPSQCLSISSRAYTRLIAYW